MKRLFDLAIGSILCLVALVPATVVAIVVALTSKGPIIHWSERVGKDNQLFQMPKFRTMLLGTPVVATHQLDNPASFLSPVGRVLRRSSLDEIPQLWCILRGEMSFVGPRPALSNQVDLIALRTSSGVYTLVPGLTGWAQINGRDDLSLLAKAELDHEYLERASLTFDMKILLLTLVKVIKGSGVSH